MPLGRAREDRPTPPEVYNWRIYTIAALACTGGAIFGYNNGVIGGCITLPAFRADFRMPPLNTPANSFVSANIISTLQGGTFFGSLATFPITERWGRRFSFILASLFFFAGSAVMTWSHGSLPMLYAGRAIAGLGLGSVTLVVPMYVSEIAPPAIRGFLVGMFEMANQLSSLGGFWVNYGTLRTIPSTHSAQWQIPLGVQMAPAAMLFIAAVFLLPETPRFYVKTRQLEKALKTLSFLRNLPMDHAYIQTELAAVQEAVNRELVQTPSKARMVRELFLPGNRNRLGIGLCLMLCQNLTGINALNYYSPSIFQSIGFEGTNVSLFATGIFAVVKSVAAVMSMIFLVDKLGRRKLLLIGALGASCAMWYIGGFITATKLDPAHPQGKTAAGYVAITFVYVFAAFISISWNPVAWIYCSEIFPNRLRTLCVSLSTATQWLGQFIIARATPYMLSDIRGGTYFFYGACLIAMATWVFFFVPETKGVSLEDMDRIFGSPSMLGPRDCGGERGVGAKEGAEVGEKGDVDVGLEEKEEEEEEEEEEEGRKVEEGGL
ncbi:hypothetical protein RUND412_006855 [Rhizina undulata]